MKRVTIQMRSQHAVPRMQVVLTSHSRVLWRLDCWSSSCYTNRKWSNESIRMTCWGYQPRLKRPHFTENSEEPLEASIWYFLKKWSKLFQSISSIILSPYWNSSAIWRCITARLCKTSLLMSLLGMMLMKGNCTKEEDIWKFLSVVHIHLGKKQHHIYSESRKLSVKNLVNIKYLEYCQVPNICLGHYEFL